MAIKKWNICVKKVYKSQGQDKAYWPSVGELVYFPANGNNKAGFSLELHLLQGTKLYVFENKPKDAGSATGQEGPDQGDAGPVSPDDIPF